MFLTEGGGTQSVWRTDGTPAGTTRLATVGAPGPYSYFTHSRHEIFFEAWLPGFREVQVWRSDGTAAGTTTLAEIPPRSPYEFPPHYQLVVGDRLFFTASETTTGFELWALPLETPFAECGDGVVQAGEACDHGNQAGGDCCSATCHLDAAGSPCTDDGNACTDDQCDGAGTCGHENTTRACDDGDACTSGDVCASGVCTGTRDPVACLHGFLCYDAVSEARRSVVHAKLQVTGASEPVDFLVKQLRQLCVPAAEDAPPADVGDLAAYRITPAKGRPRPRRQSVEVTNRFGTFALDLGAPFRLLSPSLDEAGSALDLTRLGSYRCDRVRRRRGIRTPARQLMLHDRLAAGATPYRLTRPTQLCTPLEGDAAALLCYRVASGESAPSILDVRVATELGQTVVEAIAARTVCIPSTVSTVR